MNTDKFDSEIAETISKQKALLEEMEGLRQPIINAYISFLSIDFPKDMQRKMTSDPDATQGLGMEKLSEIKKDFNQFLSNLPSLCSETLDQDKYWSHRKSVAKDKMQYEITRSAKEGVLSARADLMGFFGDFLNKHGLIKITNDRFGNEWTLKNGQVSYGYGFSWHQDEAKAISKYASKYGDLFGEYQRIVNEQDRLEKEKQAFIAGSMWDNA